MKQWLFHRITRHHYCTGERSNANSRHREGEYSCKCDRAYEESSKQKRNASVVMSKERARPHPAPQETNLTTPRMSSLHNQQIRMHIRRNKRSTNIPQRSWNRTTHLRPMLRQHLPQISMEILHSHPPRSTCKHYQTLPRSSRRRTIGSGNLRGEFNDLVHGFRGGNSFEGDARRSGRGRRRVTLPADVICCIGCEARLSSLLGVKSVRCSNGLCLASAMYTTKLQRSEDIRCGMSVGKGSESEDLHL